MDTLSQWFGNCQQWLFETLVQPALFHLGLSNFIEDGYDATMWLLVGLLQVAVLLLVFGPLQRLRPVEPVTDRRQIGIDVLYTLIHRLGVFRLALFFTIDPFWDSVFGQLHIWGFAPFQLDQYWPGVTDQAWVSLIIYLLLFDLVDYLYHRAQHRFAWLWALHAVHHSQRQMTMWSDDRNHLLDDMLRDVVVVFVSQLVGVPPAQFVAIVAITQLAQSFSHANLRMHFGAIGERLLVSPRFHRHHHSIAYDASTPGRPAATTLPRCSRSGTCCSARPASASATAPPASMTSSRNWAAATTARASGRNSGWASSAWSAATASRP